MAVAILPLLRIGGMRLFQTESSDRSQKVMPRSHMVARLIVTAYVGITILGTLAFWWAGMSLFDAVNHAMSAISTGGFSTSDQSLAKWHQPAVHWVAVVVMILGSLPFTLYVATLRGHRKALLKDQQVQGLLGLLLVTWLVLGTWYWWTTDLHWLEALRHVALNVTSVVTTTGFALGDYSLWGNFSLMLFFYLGFIGGCSGSTAGGIKIFRFQVAYILLKASLNQLIHPRAVIKQKYNGPLDPDLFLLLRDHHLRHCPGLVADRTGLDDCADRCRQHRVRGRTGSGGSDRPIRQLRQPARWRQVDPLSGHAAGPPGDHHSVRVVYSGVLASLTATTEPCSRARYSPGVTSNQRRNARKKLLGSANPSR